MTPEWYITRALIEIFHQLSQALVGLRNEVHRFSSLSSNPNALPTTTSLYDRVQRDISGLGATVFDNISILQGLSNTFADGMQQIQRGVDVYAVTESFAGAMELANSECGFKELDEGTDNLIDGVDEASRNTLHWIAYYLKDTLETIESGLKRIMHMFRNLRIPG